MSADITIIGLMLGFAFYYPLFMAFVWILGGSYYYLHWERKVDRASGPSLPPGLERHPFVSILVPCHNEALNINETIAWLEQQDYPNYEIIAIDDGSTDGTGDAIEALVASSSRLRLIRMRHNEGKAMALRAGALAARGDYLVCIDGDALLDYRATRWLVHHLTTGPRVGAVTGNPRIRNRSTMLGKLQVGEFSSIIGLIKRAQRIYGRVFTISGVVVAFRKAALQRVGYWSPDVVTDDIDISWRLQLNHWDIRYEPNALCWILMPETLRGLWRQRLRWAIGGVQVMARYARHLFHWRQRRFWGVAAEFCVSMLWAWTIVGVLVLFLLGLFLTLPPALQVATIAPQWHGVVLAFVCLLQFAVSMYIDRRYEHRLGRQFYWMIWYPIAYWLLSMLTTVAAVPATILRGRRRARWESPDRGIHQATTDETSPHG